MAQARSAAILPLPDELAASWPELRREQPPVVALLSARATAGGACVWAGRVTIQGLRVVQGAEELVEGFADWKTLSWTARPQEGALTLNLQPPDRRVQEGPTSSLGVGASLPPGAVPDGSGGGWTNARSSSRALAAPGASSDATAFTFHQAGQSSRNSTGQTAAREGALLGGELQDEQTVRLLRLLQSAQQQQQQQQWQGLEGPGSLGGMHPTDAAAALAAVRAEEALTRAAAEDQLTAYLRRLDQPPRRQLQPPRQGERPQAPDLRPPAGAGLGGRGHIGSHGSAAAAGAGAGAGAAYDELLSSRYHRPHDQLDLLQSAPGGGSAPPSLLSGGGGSQRDQLHNSLQLLAALQQSQRSGSQRSGYDRERPSAFGPDAATARRGLQQPAADLPPLQPHLTDSGRGRSEAQQHEQLLDLALGGLEPPLQALLQRALEAGGLRLAPGDGAAAGSDRLARLATEMNALGVSGGAPAGLELGLGLGLLLGGLSNADGRRRMGGDAWQDSSTGSRGQGLGPAAEARGHSRFPEQDVVERLTAEALLRDLSSSIASRSGRGRGAQTAGELLGFEARAPAGGAGDPVLNQAVLRALLIQQELSHQQQQQQQQQPERAPRDGAERAAAGSLRPGADLWASGRSAQPDSGAWERGDSDDQPRNQRRRFDSYEQPLLQPQMQLQPPRPLQAPPTQRLRGSSGDQQARTLYDRPGAWQDGSDGCTAGGGSDGSGVRAALGHPYADSAGGSSHGRLRLESDGGRVASSGPLQGATVGANTAALYREPSEAQGAGLQHSARATARASGGNPAASELRMAQALGLLGQLRGQGPPAGLLQVKQEAEEAEVGEQGQGSLGPQLPDGAEGGSPRQREAIARMLQGASLGAPVRVLALGATNVAAVQATGPGSQPAAPHAPASTRRAAQGAAESAGDAGGTEDNEAAQAAAQAVPVGGGEAPAAQAPAPRAHAASEPSGASGARSSEASAGEARGGGKAPRDRSLRRKRNEQEPEAAEDTAAERRQGGSGPPPAPPAADPVEAPPSSGGGGVRRAAAKAPAAAAPASDGSHRADSAAAPAVAAAGAAERPPAANTHTSGPSGSGRPSGSGDESEHSRSTSGAAAETGTAPARRAGGGGGGGGGDEGDAVVACCPPRPFFRYLTKAEVETLLGGEVLRRLCGGGKLEDVRVQFEVKGRRLPEVYVADIARYSPSSPFYIKARTGRGKDGLPWRLFATHTTIQWRRLADDTLVLSQATSGAKRRVVKYSPGAGAAAQPGKQRKTEQSSGGGGGGKTKRRRKAATEESSSSSSSSDSEAESDSEQSESQAPGSTDSERRGEQAGAVAAGEAAAAGPGSQAPRPDASVPPSRKRKAVTASGGSAPAGDAATRNVGGAQQPDPSATAQRHSPRGAARSSGAQHRGPVPDPQGEPQPGAGGSAPQVKEEPGASGGGPTGAVLATAGGGGSTAAAGGDEAEAR